MTVDKMKKEDLELLSNKDITNLILEESKKPLNTADLFKKIIKLLDLPDETFEKKNRRLLYIIINRQKICVIRKWLLGFKKQIYIRQGNKNSNRGR